MNLNWSSIAALFLAAFAAASQAEGQTFSRSRPGDAAWTSRGPNGTAVAQQTDDAPRAVVPERPADAADLEPPTITGGNQSDAGETAEKPPEAGETDSSETVGDAALTGLQEQLASANIPEEARKADLTAKLAEAIQALASVKSETAEAQEYQRRTNELPTTVAQLKQSLESLAEKPVAPIPDAAPLAEIEKQYAVAKSDLDAARTEVAKASSAEALNGDTLAGIREALTNTDERRQVLDATLAAARDTPGLPSAILSAYARNGLAALRAKETRLLAERTYRELIARGDFYATQLSLAELKRDRLQSRFDALASRTNRLRQQAAEQRVKDARAAAAAVPKPLQPLAERNSELAERLVATEQQNSKTEARRDSISEKVAKIRTDAEATRAKESKTGLIESVRVRLQELRKRLPDLSDRQQQMRSRLDRQREAARALVEYETELDDLGSPEEALSGFMRSAEIPPDLKPQAEKLLREKARLLTDLKQKLSTYTDNLESVDMADRDLVDEVTAFRDYIDGRMLWAPSHRSMFEGGLEWEDWRPSDRVADLATPGLYVRLGRTFWEDFREHRPLYIAAAVGLLAMFYGRQRLRRRSRDLCEAADRRGINSIVPILRVAVMTFADAAVWPAVLAFVAMRFGAAFQDDPEFLAVSTGLLRVAIAFFSMEFLHAACRSRGLAELVGVAPSVVQYIRKKVNRLEIIGLPLAAVVVLMHNPDEDNCLCPVERLVFVAACGVLMRFCHQMLRSSSPIVKDIVSRKPNGWFAKLRPALYVLVIALPVTLAAMSVVGYHVTALHLLVKVEASVWLGLIVVAARLLLSTSLRLHSRQLKHAALRKRAAARQETSGLPDDVAAVVGVRGEVKAESEAEDLGRLSEQSRRLVGTLAALTFFAGLYLIWSDVLPAVSVLSEVRAYGVTGVNGEDVPVTWAGLLGAVVAAVVAVTATRNLPGLLEFSILKRVGLDKSVCYAATTILSYVLAMVGIIVVGSLVGLSWGNLQWLAAGLSVGLGFGLQEIFANFISGLLILVEQPVRVGDVVTIDNVTGVVSRVRIRATTITNWDRKEYIVPNKEFITGRLLNWTLSDPTNRLVIPVGVAYGSDTDRVREMLLEILAENQEVLKDPAPLVTFEELGDSSLNFTVRCFLPKLDNRLMTQHALLTEIHKRFREEGIEIPFPQRDLNVRHLPAEVFTGVEASPFAESSPGDFDMRRAS